MTCQCMWPNNLRYPKACDQNVFFWLKINLKHNRQRNRNYACLLPPKYQRWYKYNYIFIFYACPRHVKCFLIFMCYNMWCGYPFVIAICSGKISLLIFICSNISLLTCLTPCDIHFTLWVLFRECIVSFCIWHLCMRSSIYDIWKGCIVLNLGNTLRKFP